MERRLGSQDRAEILRNSGVSVGMQATKMEKANSMETVQQKARDPRRENKGNSNLLADRCLQMPHQRYGQKEESEVGNYVAIAVDQNIPACLDWSTCEDTKKDGNGGPDDQNGAYGPGCDAKSEIDIENAV
ncbi:MAG: hypothetical protein Q9174_002424 [Haloplaca sp. 1 TL-2023]